MSNQEQTSLSLSNLNPNQSKSLETSLRSLENAITFNKKSHNDYKKEKIKELEKEYKMCMMTNEYEKAIIVVKKLTFFDNSSKINSIFRLIFRCGIFYLPCETIYKAS